MSPTPTRADLDPDTLAALEEQRDFLLRSLDDLEAERAAGDIDDDDYEALRDDYTARAAAVIRTIDQRTAARQAARPARRRGRTAAIVLGILAIGIVAGVLVAQASGRRDPGDNITGGGGESSRSLIAQGDQLLAEGDPEAAIGAYDEALAIDPDNVQALLKRANAEVALGDAPGAIGTYDQVLALEPENLEALAYQGSLFHREGDTERALAQIGQAIDLDPTYVDSWSLRTAVLADAGRIDEALADIEALAADGDGDIAVAVAQQASSILSPVDVLKVYDAVIAGDPGNALALTYRGWQPATLAVQGAITGEDAEAVLTDALDFLDQAVDADPTLPDAHVFRAVVLRELGRDDEARAALAAFDATDPPPEMEVLVEQFGLRESLAGG
jgi:tetratricopeptide (TPR) repeat protein